MVKSKEFGGIAEELLNKQIKPSYQRMRVLKYLVDNKNHPTADQIFVNLQKELPTLSRATIYNALNLFVKAKLVRVIKIEENEARYDIQARNHGHFKCESCGEIYDFDINIDDFELDELQGFIVNDKNVYLKGICSKCL